MNAVHAMLRVPRRSRRWSRVQWVLAVVLTGGVAALAKLVGRLWTWIAIATLIGLALGAVPLFGVLGFELAVAMTIPAALMGLDIGSAIARERQRVPAEGLDGARYAGRTLARGALVAAAVPVAILLVPAAIAAVRGIWLPTCDWWFGIEAYALLPLATGALAGALGHAIGVLVPRAERGRTVTSNVGWFLRSLAPFVPALVVAVFALWRFYAAPPVFTYNAILGYFPGNLYDENVQLGAPLLWSRLEQLAWTIAALGGVAFWLDVPSYRAALAPRPHKRPRGALLIAALAIAGGATLRYESGDLGYAVDAEDIEVALGGRIETPHFIIHYSATPELEAIIGLVAADHEFRYAQVVRQLGVEARGKLRSFYFADRDEKARMMGARDVEMAKPWRREIYLEHRPFPHGSLRHEIAHAVASEFGDPIFGVAAQHVAGLPVMFQPGLIEGLAVAADWPGGSYERMTPHELVRVLQELGKQPSIRELLSLQFFNFSSAASYTTAGSFLRFLLDTYGAAPLRVLYRAGGDFEGAYGKPLAVLEAEWRAMISTIVLPPGAIEATRERFRIPGVFSRPCPHAIAARLQQVSEANAAGDRAKAIELMRDVCRDAPEEPRFRLRLADLLSGGDSEQRAQGFALWMALAFDGKRVTTSVRARVYETLVAYAVAHGDEREARRLVDEGVTLQLDDNERRQLEALRFALHHRGPAGPALRGYFFHDGGPLPSHASWAMLAALAEPSLGFAHYLVGLQHYNTGELAASAMRLDRALALGVPGIAFVKNGARRLAVAAYRAGDAIRIQTAITILSRADMSTVEKLLAKDWFDRIAFDAMDYVYIPDKNSQR